MVPMNCARIVASSDKGLLPGQVLGTSVDPPSNFTSHAAAGARSGPGALGVASTVTLSGGLPTFYSGLLSASAQASAGYTDTVRVTSATLPLGTPVQLTITQSLTFSLLTSGSVQARRAGIFAQLLAGGLDALELYQCVGNTFANCTPANSDAIDQTLTASGVLSTRVGAAVTLSGSMGSWTAATVGLSVAQAGYVASAASVSGLNSAHTFIDSQTPGVTLLADSGHNYAALAVPEPAPLALLLAGLGVLAVRARARRLSAP